MKVVINSDFGGFSLSDEAVREYAKQKGIPLVEEKDEKWNDITFYVNSVSEENYFSARDFERNDEVLVKVVEKLGNKANGFCATLKVVEIPEGVDWYVEEYDGREWVAEKHRTWM
jgi:hypothetical protein